MCFLKETDTQKAQRASAKITYKPSQLRFDLFKTCQVLKKRLTREYNYGIIIVVVNIGMSPSGKAPDFDSGIRRFKSGHPSQIPKDKSLGIYFFTLHSSLFTLHTSLCYIIKKAAATADFFICGRSYKCKPLLLIPAPSSSLWYLPLNTLDFVY